MIQIAKEDVIKEFLVIVKDPLNGNESDFYFDIEEEQIFSLSEVIGKCVMQCAKRLKQRRINEIS